MIVRGPGDATSLFRLLSFLSSFNSLEILLKRRERGVKKMSAPSTPSLSVELRGSLSNDNDDENENVKKQLVFMNKPTALLLHHAFETVTMVLTDRRKTA